MPLTRNGRKHCTLAGSVIKHMTIPSLKVLETEYWNGIDDSLIIVRGDGIDLLCNESLWDGK